MNKNVHKLCRACLEPSPKLYPLIGSVANVDVNIATMLTYCISSELVLSDDLPNSVCVPCFKTIRIAYNFLKQFREAQEALVKEEVNLEDTDNKNGISVETLQLVVGETLPLNEKTISNNMCCTNCPSSSTTETYYGSYDVNLIHNYAEKVYSEETESDEICNVKIKSEMEDADSLILQGIPEETSDQYISYLEYVTEDSLKVEIENIKVCPSETSSVEEFIINDSDTTEMQIDKFIKKDNTSQSNYVCPVCEEIFCRLPKFTDHLLLHKADIIKCNKCSVPIELSKNDYITHYKEYHRYQCNICNKSLLSSYGYRYHMKQHENIRKYACPVKDCSRSFFLFHLLQKHMRIHSEIVKYTCDLCTATFKTYDTFRYHQKTHDGKRNHLCTQCGKAFFQAVHLRDHMYRHNGYKRFTCDRCGTSFTTNSQLKKHIKYCIRVRKMKES